MKQRVQSALSFLVTASGIFYFLEIVWWLILAVYDRVYQDRPWEWAGFLPCTIFTLAVAVVAAWLIRRHDLETAEILEDFGKSLNLYLVMSLIASAVVVGFLDPSYLKPAAYIVFTLVMVFQFGPGLWRQINDVCSAGLSANALRIKWALLLLIVKELPAGTLEFLETQEEAWESS